MVSLEGYSRAKEILLGKFGESTKITAAPFNVLPALPVIQYPWHNEQAKRNNRLYKFDLR